MTRKLTIPAALAVVVLAGCGDTTRPTTEAGPPADSAVADAGPDSGPPELDSGVDACVFFPDDAGGHCEYI